MRIGVIGAAGNMAGAIISGLQKSSAFNNHEIYLCDIPENADKLKKYLQKGTYACQSIRQLTNISDYIILAVKPQIVPDVISDISGAFTPEKCIVSIAAGVKIEKITGYIGQPCKVVRVMPNTPLMLSQGASALCRSNMVNDAEFDFVMRIFSVAGISVECPEKDINTVTALSGSGPAYVFKFAKAMIDQSVQLGLDREIALRLACQTLIGSAHMLLDSEKTPDELIKMVTSPKGTTLAALESLDANEFDSIVKQAVCACKQRADELGKN